MSPIADKTLKITNTKLCILIVTLSRECKTCQTIKGFKRPVYWNERQTKIETRDLDNNNLTRFAVDDFFSRS